MIEIDTMELIKNTQKVLIHRKGQAPFYQERKKSDKPIDTGKPTPMKDITPAKIKKVLKTANIKLGTISQSGGLQGMTVKHQTPLAIKIDYMRSVKEYQLRVNFDRDTSHKDKKDYCEYIVSTLNESGVKAKYDESAQYVSIPKN